MAGSWVQQIAAWWSPAGRGQAATGVAAAGASGGSGSLGSGSGGGAQVLDGPREAGVPALGKQHLVVMVHGLFGTRDNWTAISELLAQQLDPATTVLFVSHCNERHKTFEGIDVCGERLAAEIQAVAARHPGLTRISLMGHSMGGLISRYAAGRLYDPSSGTMAGLTPSHFVAIATPHLGCDAQQNPAQVPLINWLSAVPAVGGAVHRVASELAGPFSKAAMGRAGLQFFLMDQEPGPARGLPLLFRLAQDRPEEGLLFLSALAAFETRTLYANSSGDHLVGWANSSLRRMEELPTRSGRGTGVVREDPLETAWGAAQRPRLHATPAAAQLHGGEGRQVSQQAILQASSAGRLGASGGGQLAASGGGSREGAREDDMQAGGSSSAIVSSSSPNSQTVALWARHQPLKQDLSPAAAVAAAVQDATEAAAAAGAGSSPVRQQVQQRQQQQQQTATAAAVAAAAGGNEQRVEVMLSSLQSLSWRRVDVCFGATLLPLLSHQHIQMQRWWVNWPGRAVVKHLALQVQAMEQLRAQQQQQALPLPPPPQQTLPPHQQQQGGCAPPQQQAQTQQQQQPQEQQPVAGAGRL